MSQTTINNGDGGSVARAAINNNFTELYAAIPTPIKLSGQSADTIIALPANTWLNYILITVTANSPTIKIGTVANAGDIMEEMTSMAGSYKIQIDKYFSSAQNIYFTISGGTISARIDITKSAL